MGGTGLGSFVDRASRISLGGLRFTSREDAGSPGCHAACEAPRMARFTASQKAIDAESTGAGQRQCGCGREEVALMQTHRSALCDRQNDAGRTSRKLYIRNRRWHCARAAAQQPKVDLEMFCKDTSPQESVHNERNPR